MQCRFAPLLFPIRCGLSFATVLSDSIQSIRMGDVADFRNFMGAVIDARAFEKISGYIKRPGNRPTPRSLPGARRTTRWAISFGPCCCAQRQPDYRTMTEEIFGPVVTVFVYPEREWQSTLELVIRRSPYGLTGAVFANDRKAIDDVRQALRVRRAEISISTISPQALSSASSLLVDPGPAAQTTRPVP